MLERKIYSVSQINRYIKGVLENDIILSGIWVKGEISNFKKHSSGHMYFTLKDSDGAISAIMFKVDAMMMPYVPENGMSVIVYGYISLFEKTGQYQLYAQIMEPAGLGSLAAAYEQMKKRLEEEGLFDNDFKREICPAPKKIAVITSPTGAAIRDIINVSHRRNPAVEIVVIPVLVQGERAADDIVQAIKDVNAWNKADTIILARGGGSIEDLWAFNEEKVARAIFASNIPVISAIGHETDFTIADFVSDMRAPTPSAAAELAVNDVYSDIYYLDALKVRLDYAFDSFLSMQQSKVEMLMKSVSPKSFQQRLSNEEMYVEKLIMRTENSVNSLLKDSEYMYMSLTDKLHMLSPLNVLKRGYSVLYDKDMNTVTSAKEIEEGGRYVLQLKDGQADMLAGKVEM
ncbi:MAG: exodeoxyribonuclease VII large subunit [Firmicutes bacterium]|nr:exodeoxyribonuclease VII large subunit [Bacillota bacterium]